MTALWLAMALGAFVAWWGWSKARRRRKGREAASGA